MFSRRLPRVYQGCLWGVSLCCLWAVSKVNQSDWKRFNVIQSGPKCLRFALSDLMRLKDFDQSDSKWINVNLKLTSSTNPKTVASQSFWSLLWWHIMTIYDNIHHPNQIRNLAHPITVDESNACELNPFSRDFATHRCNHSKVCYYATTQRAEVPQAMHCAEMPTAWGGTEIL